MPDVRSDAEPVLAWGRVIGLPVAASDLGSVGGHVIRMAKRGCGRFVCVANVHMLVTARRDAKLRQVLERAAIVVSDGMPLVRRLRASGFPEARQVRGPDFMIEVCRRAAEERLHDYFFCGDDALKAKLKVALVRRLPELRMAGCEAAPMLPCSRQSIQ
jgi:N-acetylglucosaminyldiphosphoundecaprenol N-acetyl-beta-D-mannosaminyltransferase